MKIFHIADLHLGKRVNEVSMIDEQSYILDEIVQYIDKEKPKALIIAGDIYDRAIPSAESVKLFDMFLNNINKLDLKVYIITGNHDSKERLSFASSILKNQGFYIESDYKQEVFMDQIEDVNLYMIPFIKPQDVRPYYGDETIETYQEAFEKVMNTIELDDEKLNICVAHQFVTHQNTSPTLSDSESLNIGGLDNIDTSLFEGFDYVALGHIHRPQRIGRDTIRYAGSILKYSQSEVHHKKSITVLDIEEKNIKISTLPLIPEKDMVHYEGYLEEILQGEYDNLEDYVYITLLDEDEMVDALGRLRKKFPNLLNIGFKNQRVAFDNTESLSYEALDKMNPLDLFDTFYEKQNNKPLTDTQKEQVKILMEALDETH